MARTATFDRDEMIAKAMKLFWRKGYHNTSIQDLVDTLGINRASMYNTFGSKEGLFMLALETYQQQNGDIFDQLFGEDKDPWAVLSNLLKRSLYSTKEENSLGCFMVNCASELIPQYPEFMPYLLANKEWFVKQLEPIVKRGQALGQITKNQSAKNIARYLYTFNSGLKVTGKLDISRQQLAKVIEVGLDAIRGKN